MEITKCEYCNAYVTNCEVHNCVKFGNQHRRTSATLPQGSSGNVSEDIGLITAEEMEDDALWPFVRQKYLSDEVLYSTRNPIHTLNTTEQPETFSFATLAWDDPLENLLFSTNSLSGNSDENIFNIPETDNTNNISDPISIQELLLLRDRLNASFCDKAPTDKII
ncbi:hypothetical protein CEXT_773941 [Caerostris extrusa]|uniref:Uncharacterized protein n=1 Tax=Caerostris extrusa TaxID=172846 RepID=A0AAV4RJF6_CAEEX|nr:hypothetical protein CEXT_773941 [Caerostris extrusa]